MKFSNHHYHLGQPDGPAHCMSCTSCVMVDHSDPMMMPFLSKKSQSAPSIRCTRLQELLVRGSGIDAIKAHIEKFPLSPQSMDRFGRSPLFWAIKLARSDNIIRHMYLAAPNMLLSYDVYGKTCLDLLYAPQTRNPWILRWLFKQDPSLAVSKSPSPFIMPLLHRICIRWSLSSHFDAVDMEMVLATIEAAHCKSCCRCHVNIQHMKRSSIPVLHMALQLGLPSLVLAKLARFFPDDLRSLPRSISPIVPLHFFLSNYSPIEDSHAMAFLVDILESNPQTANERIQPMNGKPNIKPLHAAIENGFAWKSLNALNCLIQAAPWVLHETDPDTLLLPFQLAACTTRPGDAAPATSADTTAQLDTIFTLLRAQPNVMIHRD